MGLSSLGRRIGDWLGIVADDDDAARQRASHDATGAGIGALHDEQSPDEQLAEPALPAAPAEVQTVPAARRVRRYTPTDEYRAEVRRFLDAVNELRSGLG